MDAEYVRQLARSGEGGLPSWVKTEMDVADQAAGGYVDSDIVERGADGRFAAPDDIAEAIAFLADPTARGFVNRRRQRSPSKVGG